MLVRTEAGVAEVRLNRPEARNALNLPMCVALREIFADLDADERVRVVVVRAAGPVFCAGADLKERRDKDEAWVRRRRLASFSAYETIERCGKPVVAVVDGPVVGSGGEIAMSCDFVLGSDAATFRFPEPHRGTVGATQRLQRVVGKRRAKELLFTGRVLLAAEAAAIGLITRLTSREGLEALAADTVSAIAAAPPLSLGLTKQSVDLGEEVALTTGIRIELAAIERNLAEGEWRRGVEEFGDRNGK
ncbi:enoyl-CoA hydratase/isomerase family protein [Amycolatopsis jiangsuensis]|uniref:Enoyl-CoA hydratase n=1 Tax=Amycolatopsis jiangsuensis TaxID=1181879 RepID=A0A840ISZ8_9PSEU|nr:enoyl-CoA hydratase/isomerase family protein [Amycolatopsis jiangsuensis]MBB4684104.1 enoyl-CoA hydratase [Amycolatopsis jiangsuensis]